MKIGCGEAGTAEDTSIPKGGGKLMNIYCPLQIQITDPLPDDSPSLIVCNSVLCSVSICLVVVLVGIMVDGDGRVVSLCLVVVWLFSDLTCVNTNRNNVILSVFLIPQRYIQGGRPSHSRQPLCLLTLAKFNNQKRNWALCHRQSTPALGPIVSPSRRMANRQQMGC